MIIAPGAKRCDLCEGIMHLQWSVDRYEWKFAYEDHPPSDNVHLRLYCSDCAHTADPFEDPEVEHMFNVLKYNVIRVMFDRGIYSYWKPTEN